MSENEFEQVLTQLLEAQEKGDLERQQQLLGMYPQYSAEFEEFLTFEKRIVSAMSAKEPSAPLTIPDEANATISSETQLDSPEDGSVWSLGRLDNIVFPAQFGNYLLLSEIDRGGMGIVFKARHHTLQRVVALKIMRSGHLATAEEVRRFRVEAEASSTLKHPNIIPIYEVGEEHGLLYFTMAYIDGEDLAATIKMRPLNPRESARLLLKVTEAVAAAHRHGVIHRDLKPSNILIGTDGEPHVVDFGLAKLIGFDEELTHTGQILGTPAYMPPEQARGDRTKQSNLVDIYAIGAILYAMLTRQAPFHGPTAFDIMLQVLDREPSAPSRIAPSVPKSLEAICLRAMAKEPKDRYQSAELLAADLARFLKDEPIQPPKPGFWDGLEIWWRREPILVSHLCGIGAVMMIVLVAFMIRQDGPDYFAYRFGLLSLWAAGSIALQQLSLDEKRKDAICLAWASFDIVIYTTLIYFASPPRGLLLIGYPMMIAASGLFYRVSFVVFMTSLCIVGFLFLVLTVDDPIGTKSDFVIIYVSGLAVLGLCLVSMIRRVRGLSRFCEETSSQD